MKARRAASGRGAAGKSASEEELLDALVRERGTARPSLAGISTGELVGFDGDGAPLVATRGEGAGRALRARAATALGADALGCEVVLAFEDCDPFRPIVLGVIREARRAGAAQALETAVRVEVGETRLLLHVDREVVVHCGASSLTLSPDGRISVRGTHLLSRASGSNRIKGGSVQIN